MITAEMLAAVPLFAALSDTERSRIAGRAADVQLQAGEWLFQEGEVPAFFVVLEGQLVLVKTLDGIEQLVRQHHVGDFLGEVPLLLGATTFASAYAPTPTRILRLDPADFQTLIAAHPAMSARLLQTMAERLGQIEQFTVRTPVRRVGVVGHRWDEDSQHYRDFLARNHVAFDWLDLDQAESREGIPSAAKDASAYPVIILPDDTLLLRPEFRPLAERLGLQTRPASSSSYDVAIVGGGASGTRRCGIGASEGLKTIVIDRQAPGGQAGTSTRIENYLGFPNGISGDELSHRAWQQARRFGAEMLVARRTTGLDATPGAYAICLDGDEYVSCQATILAMGVSWRRLQVPGLDHLVGKGVYYGAARTEALAIRGKDIYLVGGGNSAGQAAVYFAGFARSVTLLVRGSALSASMSQYLIDQLNSKHNIAVSYQSEVVAVKAATAAEYQHLESVVVRNRQTGEERTLATEALFVLISADADTGWLPPAIARDSQGYILTGRDVLADPLAAERWSLERHPFLLETSAPGIFAAGDVRNGSIKRVASAVGEGSMAISFVHQYLAQQGSQQ